MKFFCFLILIIFGQINLSFGQDSLDVFDESIVQICSRYGGKNFDLMISHFKDISNVQSIRIKFFESLKKVKGIDWQILIETSSSGETYSYSATAFGFTNDREIKKMEFEWITYFDKPKCRIRNLKKMESLMKAKESLFKNEYDVQTKTDYPADLIIISYKQFEKWNFRISDKPTPALINLMSFGK